MAAGTQPASRKSRGPRLKETKREKKRRRKVRRKQKVSIHFCFFHFHLPTLMSFLFVPYVSRVNPVQYTGVVSRHSIGWICSYFYYFFLLEVKEEEKVPEEEKMDTSK